MGDQRPAWAKNLALFSVIIADLMVCSAMGIGLGYLAWKKAGAPAWVIGVTSALGLSLAFYRVYRYSNRSDETE